MKLYIHTVKAIKKGCLADRVFLVVQEDTCSDGKHLDAWKCSIRKNGLSHPAFKRLLKFELTDLQLGALKEGKNGSSPTAYFKPDSFYETVTLLELTSLYEKRKKLIRQQEAEERGYQA